MDDNFWPDNEEPFTLQGWLEGPIDFPPVEYADESGVLCWGGNLEAQTLINAYTNGIFPWPHRGYPLLWFAPPQRAVLLFDELHVGTRLRRFLKSAPFEIRFDTAFSDVIRACAAPRIVDGEHEDQTWISPQIISSYEELFRLGFAHSVETWRDGELVGGLYGVRIGAHFCGESMFYRAENASKAAVLALVERLQQGGATWLDIETMTPHFAKLGAKEIERADFVAMMRAAQIADFSWD